MLNIFSKESDKNTSLIKKNSNLDTQTETNRSFFFIPVEDIYQAMEVTNGKSATEKDKTFIKKAYDFAKRCHDGQLRKSGEPYMNHCICTAINIAKQNMDAETIVAGLLHDVLEDTKATEDELRMEFGQDILFLVQGVTKLGHVKYQGVERHVESMRKFFIASSSDIRVVIIKLCDRLHNISTLKYVREDKRKRIAIETLEIHARLADRIGMGKLKAKLEDKAFPYAYPDDYTKVVEMFENLKHSSGEHLLDILKEVKEELSIFNIDFLKIDHRLKHMYSLYEKLKKNNWDIQKIYDIAAMRVIVSDMAICYQTLGVIHGLYKPVPGRFKDYIAVPKPNGYQSLHTTVFDGKGGTFEVQIRTEKMHQDAEYGIASHLNYKEIGDSKNKKVQSKIQSLQESDDTKLSWTKELLEHSKEETKNTKEKISLMDRLKSEFFELKIFVHTPKGDVVELPIGSSVIDFAYSIHSSIGDHISGAMINGKLSSLDKKIKNGDVVEIIKSDNAKPSRKWIDMAYTTHAKRHIRNYIKEHGSTFDKLFVK